MAHRHSERPFNGYPPPYPHHLPPTAQPPIQIPFSDPFQTSRDPFMPSAHGRRSSFGMGGGWPPTNHAGAPGNSNIPQQHPTPHTSHSPALSTLPPPPPPPPPHGFAQMPLPFDPSRRRSLGAAGSPPQYGRASLDQPPPPPSFAARNMPPPSPPQMPPPSASAHLASAPRGPPTSSPFAGVRDLPGFAPHRPGPGYSISSILGGDERRPQGSPHTTAAMPTSTPHMMRPPSPGRVRSSSMREHREPSPMRGMVYGEPRAQSAFHERPGPDTRRDVFASPQFPRESPHSFRAFKPEQETRTNGINLLGRPSSQPTELQGPRSVEEILARREASDGRFGTFRHFGEPLRNERATPHHDAHPFPNGVTSQPREHDVFGSPQLDRDARHIPGRFHPGAFGTPMREDQAGLFRPSFHHVSDAARESIEGRTLLDLRREEPRSSPPINDMPPYLRGRNGFMSDRPMTFEEHQRMEAMQREQQRKESDGSGHRMPIGISQELNRKGRNSPLPQAVQGAQPRFVGPGGDNPGIKMEFGRMFSGLGSGVGSTTPTAGQSVNGTTTPSRLSPPRYIEDGDLVRTAVAGIEDGKTKSKGGRKNGRHSLDSERIDVDGRMTPDLQRGSKRTKTSHPAHHHHLHSHHHHHHHHEQADPSAGSFNMLRFPSNPGVAHSTAATHHHHHATHGHPAHHHHHHPAARPLPKRAATIVNNTRLLEEAATKPRKHLGSQLYTTELSLPANANLPLDAKVKFTSKMRPIPCFEGKANCTYTVRVPRLYLASTQRGNANEEPSPLEEICKRRQIWGTEVYTDDSDVVAAAVHSGWLKGDYGESNQDVHDLCDIDSDADDAEEKAEGLVSLTKRPPKPVKVPDDHDIHVTVLLLPALEKYPSTMQHHVRSRDWKDWHDGMSFMIHRIDFVDEAGSNRFAERGIAARKHRIAIEEAKRREAAASLLMFATGTGAGTVSVGA